MLKINELNGFGISSWTPAELSPEIWIDLNDRTTLFQDISATPVTPVTGSGQPVGAILNKGSLGGYLVFQSTDANRAIYYELSGRGVLEFSGDALTYILSFSAYTMGNTSMAVCQAGGSSGTRSAYRITNSTETNSARFIMHLPYEGTVYFDAHSSAGGGRLSSAQTFDGNFATWVATASTTSRALKKDNVTIVSAGTGWVAASAQATQFRIDATIGNMFGGLVSSRREWTNDEQIKVTAYYKAIYCPEITDVGSSNEIWVDPSDFSTMWQNDARTVPVTAVGQNVRAIRNKGTLGGFFWMETFETAFVLRMLDGVHYLENTNQFHSLKLNIPQTRLQNASVAVSAYMFNRSFGGADAHCGFFPSGGFSANARTGLAIRGANNIVRSFAGSNGGSTTQDTAYESTENFRSVIYSPRSNRKIVTVDDTTILNSIQPTAGTGFGHRPNADQNQFAFCPMYGMGQIIADRRPWNDADMAKVRNFLKTKYNTLAFPIDLVTGTTTSHAYGLRKLRAGYNGPCVRMIRNDNAELDIGFAHDGSLDLDAIMVWTNRQPWNAQILTIYNQSASDGSNANCTKVNNINRPTIINESGTKRLAIFMDSDSLITLPTPSITFPVASVVARMGTFDSDIGTIFARTNTLDVAGYTKTGAGNPNNLTRLNSTTSLVWPNETRKTFYFDASGGFPNSPYFGLNGSALVGPIGTQNAFHSQINNIFSSLAGVGYNFVGTWHELIIFNGALTPTERTNLENNQSQYYRGFT